MVTYNLKRTRVVPSSKDMIDIVLSKTQRKTPTVVHKGYAISRIRSFYMRKVKFAQQTFHDKLSNILEDFPMLDEMHPFYSDLINVLYDKDHFKLALGQLAKARALVDSLAKDYVRLLKYADSLYRCKQLKRAALGRMCTLMKRHNASLLYLEQVRQHMSRLPTIDPSTRTLLIAGFPNVGKSSFINCITRADVDVQPYAFTTKSLFVGHMDYQYLRWQVIDTPGILDKLLEERNTIEMQSITALAHLRSCVVFFMDPSEHCGHSLEQQVALLRSLAPLFTGKPVIVVLNKTDLGWEQTLGDEQKALLHSLLRHRAAVAVEDSGGEGAAAAPHGVADAVLRMSTLDLSGVMAARNAACDLLLQQRVESKVRTRRGESLLQRIHVAQPSKPRPAHIPPSVLAMRERRAAAGSMSVEDDEADHTDAEDTPVASRGSRRTHRELQWELGGPGVYTAEWRDEHRLKHAEWAFDVIPEIVDGHNIADFVDPEIDSRLAALEDEELAREAAVVVEREAYDADNPVAALSEEQRSTFGAIRERKALLRAKRIRDKARNRATITRGVVGVRQELPASELREHLGSIGVEAHDADELVAGIAVGGGATRKRGRSAAEVPEEAMEEEVQRADIADEEHERGRPRLGLPSVAKRLKAREMAQKQQKLFRSSAKRGEADRHIPTKRPKHLFSGKRGMGTSQRR